LSTCRSIGNIQSQIETLSELAIVHPHQYRRQTKIDMKSLQRGQGDQGQLHVMMCGQCLGVHNVHIGLGELAIAALLRTLASPDLLNLVAPKGKGKLVSVLEDVTGKRHSQVETQTKISRLVGIAVQPLDGVDLLVYLPLLSQAI
jgi:hypothetical protein